MTSFLPDIFSSRYYFPARFFLQTLFSRFHARPRQYNNNNNNNIIVIIILYEREISVKSCGITWDRVVRIQYGVTLFKFRNVIVGVQQFPRHPVIKTALHLGKSNGHNVRDSVRTRKKKALGFVSKFKSIGAGEMDTPYIPLRFATMPTPFVYVYEVWSKNNERF